MNTRSLLLPSPPRTSGRRDSTPAFPILLRNAGVLLAFQGLISTAYSQTPAGWITIQDMSKKCQIALPSTWAVTPDGQATTPDGGQVVLVVGSNKPLTPLAPDMQKLLQVDRLIENSSQRVFYSMKPQDDKLEYIVDQQFKAARCELQLIVPKGNSEAQVMKIVATLRSTN